MSNGFCDRCGAWLPDRKQTAHSTADDCIVLLKSAMEWWREESERQHRWVHDLEDTIAELRRQAVGT